MTKSSKYVDWTYTKRRLRIRRTPDRLQWYTASGKDKLLSLPVANLKTAVSRILTVVVSTALSLTLGEVILLQYEETYLSTEMPVPEMTKYVNLSKLNYNDRGVHARKGPDEYRILSFGDSFCYSIMKPSYSYSGRIESYLNEAQASLSFRVVNLGEPATSLNDYMAAYEYWSKVLEHDAALFNIYLGNDLLDIAYHYVPPKWTPNRLYGLLEQSMFDGRLRLIPRKFPLRMLDYSYATYLSLTQIADSGPPGSEYGMPATHFKPSKVFREIAAKQMDNFDESKLEALTRAYTAVERFFRFLSDLQKRGTQVMVSLAPNEIQVDHVMRKDIAEEFGLDLDAYDLQLPVNIVTKLRDHVDPGVSVLNLVPHFMAEFQNSGIDFYYKNNTHWRKEGNELAAVVIASQMNSDWFGGESLVPSPVEERRRRWLKNYRQKVSDRAIEEYLARSILGNRVYGFFENVEGISHTYRLFDRVTKDPRKISTAPLESPVRVTLRAREELQEMRIHLFDFDDRSYRLLVKGRRGTTWTTLLDRSKESVRGIVVVPLRGSRWNEVVITGLYNSAQARNPKNTFLHLKELEFH